MKKKLKDFSNVLSRSELKAVKGGGYCYVPCQTRPARICTGNVVACYPTLGGGCVISGEGTTNCGPGPSCFC